MLHILGVSGKRLRAASCFRWMPELSNAFCSASSAGCQQDDSRDTESSDRLEYDVCVVGAGPAGLSAAIKLKKLAKAAEREVSVCVLEKGSEVGAHILSGNVLDPQGLNELFPKDDPEDEEYGWQKLGAPVTTKVTKDRFAMLSRQRRFWFPLPRQMYNKGNYIISLSELCRWLAERAEEEGVDILPGCAASDLLINGFGQVEGVTTRDMGIAKDGSRKDEYMPGVQVRARATLFAEGCRGSLSEKLIDRFDLRRSRGAEHQTYALGIKEVWEVDPAKHNEGYVEHTIGYPLDTWTYGGAFLYHMSGGRVALGFVTALDYRNPHLSPYQEFQRWKAHPYVSRLLEGGTCVQYGARTLNEGGHQSVPAVAFPGGGIIGCSAGFLNVPRLKGTHTAMKSGIVAAEAIFKEMSREESPASGPLSMTGYQRMLDSSWVMNELERVKNIRPGFKWGLWPGLINAALETYLYPWLFGGPPWTLTHNHPDRTMTQPAADCKPIAYPRPDGKITFDVPTSLYRSGTNHDHDQPPHLVVKSPGAAETVNKKIFDGPETRYCPAGVYEYVTDSVTGRPQLQVNAQNCLHCKACDIKDPTRNIEWTVPEGGGGPNYTMT